MVDDLGIELHQQRQNFGAHPGPQPAPVVVRRILRIGDPMAGEVGQHVAPACPKKGPGHRDVRSAWRRTSRWKDPEPA
jgi:hypothetical protein